jgi:hypothetical protein
MGNQDAGSVVLDRAAADITINHHDKTLANDGPTWNESLMVLLAAREGLPFNLLFSQKLTHCCRKRMCR